ncbi:hypothetical protein PCI56_27995 [Plesiomonas shigelloides subsp. oncorhynchi]|nr:hypothetical protein [Plesiomonas shigelloides]
MQRFAVGHEKISGDTKKNTFIMIMLPVIKKINQQIEDERSQLISLHAKQERGTPLSPEQKLWLENLADQYDVSSGNYRELLQRVNTIPASLVLAQSIQESGWGHLIPHERVMHCLVSIDRQAIKITLLPLIVDECILPVTIPSITQFLHISTTSILTQHTNTYAKFALICKRGRATVRLPISARSCPLFHAWQVLYPRFTPLNSGADLEQYDDISLADNPPVTVSFQDA